MIINYESWEAASRDRPNVEDPMLKWVNPEGTPEATMDNAEMLGMEIGAWVLGQRYREAAEAPTLKAIQDSGDSVAEEIAKAENAHEERVKES